MMNQVLFIIVITMLSLLRYDLEQADKSLFLKLGGTFVEAFFFMFVFGIDIDSFVKFIL